MSEVTETVSTLSSSEAIDDINVPKIHEDISRSGSRLPISRRRFLKGMGALIAGEVLVACSGPTNPPKVIVEEEPTATPNEEPVIEAVENYVTVGEISDVFRNVYGEYSETV